MSFFCQLVCQQFCIYKHRCSLKEPEVIVILILTPALQNFKEPGYLSTVPEVLSSAGYDRHHCIRQACSRFY